MLLPPDLRDWIPEDDLVHFVIEAVEQMPVIDYVFCPVGAGTAILGLYMGMAELAAVGMLPRMPRFVAVQASGYSPIAHDLGATPRADSPSILADAIAIASPPRRLEVVDAVRSTGGFGMVADDAQIHSALRFLVSRGYIVEPTSAVPLAGLMQAVDQGTVPEGSTALVPLTGTGMKALDEVTQLARAAA